MDGFKREKQQWLLKSCFALCLFGVMVVLALGSNRNGQLESVLESGVLKIITRNSPTTYYQDRDQISGFEYELAQAFARHLGVELEVEIADSLDDLITRVETGKVQLAAAGLTITPERLNRVTFGDSYLKVTQQLIYRSDKPAPADLQDLLNSRLVVTEHSSHSQYLRELQQKLLPQLSWIERNDAEVVELVQMVANGEIDYTIVDSNEFQAIDTFFPRVRVAFDLSEQQQLAWAFQKYGDPSLQQEAKRFFQTMREKGQLAQLQERYYGHLNQIDNTGTLTFLKQVDNRLGKYKPTFKKAAEEHDLDWRLVAAIGYQESHWRPRAKSRTGVRGLMMLTRTTAKEVGVKNRLNATQSINGGARYFKKLQKRFDHIAEPDRTWLALAAYNVGLGHVRDAQNITTEQGGNANRWMDVKERLPLLTKKKYYSKTRYGYARGYEPVTYVQNIRRFYDLLVWSDQPEPSYALGNEGEEGVIFTASAGFTTIPPLTSIN